MQEPARTDPYVEKVHAGAVTLRVAILCGELLGIPELVILLRAGGAEVSQLAEPAPDPDRTVHLVLLDQELLIRDGRSLVERVRERYPTALVCLLAPFAHRALQASGMHTELWDTLYLPAQADEVNDLLFRTEGFLARQERADRPRDILIVDDEEAIREASAMLVSQLGWRAETAVDALEAIGKLQQRSFDLVVTDLQMPGMDGVALLGKIRLMDPVLPVVISTGHATVDTAVAALRTGAVDFIRKPFTVEGFQEVIKRALRFGELSRANRKLEKLAHEEKILLRERQYELRVLASAIADMSRAVEMNQVADCWLRAVGQALDFVCGGFLLVGPEPQLVLLDRGGEECRPERLLALFSERAPELLAGVRLEELHVRRIVDAGNATRSEQSTPKVAQVHVLVPPVNPCAGVVLVQVKGEGPTALQESFLNSLTAPAAQVLEKLRALDSEARVREAAMVAGMHQGVILVDLEGRILVINAAARALLALPPEEEARSLSRLSAERAIPLDTAVAELLRSGYETLSREFSLSPPLERILTLDLSMIRSETREAIAVVGLLRDITEMRESERMKSEFVAIVSHELRTPLTTIKNCNSLLLGGGTGPISPPQERFLRMAQVSVDRIIRLVDDLLDVARIESGRLNLECATFDLAGLLREIGNETEHLLLERGLQLTYVGLDAPLMVHADCDRLRQVFFNLLDNAVKFSQEGGTIQLHAAIVAARDLAPDLHVLFSATRSPVVEVAVIDEGVGIAQADLERIFDRFQQAETTLQREHGGVGLGLPISRGIVRSHGGEIRAERREGGGSIFRVLLPVVAAGEEGPDGSTASGCKNR